MDEKQFEIIDSLIVKGMHYGFSAALENFEKEYKQFKKSLNESSTKLGLI